jgi:hypothetical protein
MCRQERSQWWYPGVQLPAQRLSAGQENGLRTGWLVQPGAPEIVLGWEKNTFDFSSNCLRAKRRYPCRWGGIGLSRKMGQGCEE